MNEVLQHINRTDGVIGSALFSHKGEVLAHAFPSLFDVESLRNAATLVLECTHGLQVSQTLDLLDLRYSEGRVLVKAFPGSLLFLLCTNAINLQVLSITLNFAIKKLGSTAPTASPHTAAPGSKDADGLLRIKISHLDNKQASASFDSLGMVAVSQATYQYIAAFHNNAPFKKLLLANHAAGKSGAFPVMVMKDMDERHDGTIVVGPGIEKKLGASDGDTVEVRIG
jgi:predicted regulator of Ras-like GTPase activity (Roadblock/LC7/MglB family)